MRTWLRNIVAERTSPGKLAAGILLGVVGTVFFAALGFVLWPLPEGLVALGDLEALRVTDRNGVLLREVWSREDGRAVRVPLDALPPHLAQAFLAAEDARFYDHAGVDLRASARAAYRNLRAGHVVQGGSTLTQQLARSLVPRPRTMLGKLQEALWAFRLEAHLTKPEILDAYLNRVSFGNGTFGVEAASRLYFQRSSRHVSVRQAATLAALIRGPTAYNPYRQVDRLEARVGDVLDRMEGRGYLDASSRAEALREPLDLAAPSTVFLAPHAVDFALSRATASSRGNALRLTVDAELQRDVERDVRSELARLGGRGVGNAAVLVVDNARGEVLAYVGSARYFDEDRGGQNDGVQMRRQPGSTLKPFLYGAGFAQGFTAATLADDVAMDFSAEKGAYRPENYDEAEHGPVRLREALGSSYNIPAVQLQNVVGTEPFLKLVRAAGFRMPMDAQHYGLGLTLGSGDVSLWELATAYRGLARGGVAGPLRMGPNVPVSPEVPRVRFLDAAAAGLVADVLSDNDARLPAFGARSPLRFPYPVAVKTGTSKGFSDNWTVGFTHERTVAVWTGNFDGSSMSRVSGVTGAGPLFHRVMERAMRGISPAPLVAAEVEQAWVRVDICPVTGKRVGAFCHARTSEKFIRGTVPHDTCDEASHVSPQSPLMNAALTATLTERAPVAILSPSTGTEFRRISDLPGASQAIPFRLQVDAPGTQLELWMDGARHSMLAAPYRTSLTPVSGRHHLEVRRPGETRALAESEFSVR